MVNYVLYYVCLYKWLKKEKSMVKLKLQKFIVLGIRGGREDG